MFMALAVFMSHVMGLAYWRGFLLFSLAFAFSAVLFVLFTSISSWLIE